MPSSSVGQPPDLRDSAAELSRRAFMDRSIKAIAAFMGLSLGIPAVGYLISPALQQQDKQWVKLGQASLVNPGVPTLFAVTLKQTIGWVEAETRQAYFVYTDDGNTFTVMSNICTHLGCQTHWDESEGYIKCPCHDGKFDVHGQVVGGPPPRPLKRLEFKLDENGTILSREV